jgi:hypothetical protein
MAERARARKNRKDKDKGGNGIGHNSRGSSVTDQIYNRWLSRIDTADAIYQRAKDNASSKRGELNAIYAAAKEDGCNVRAIKAARKKHRSDHLEVAMDYDDEARVLRLMKSPLVEQLSLFPEVKEARDPLVTAAMEGELAGRRGDSVDDNPYTVGTEQYVKWRAKWDEGQASLAEQFRE